MCICIYCMPILWSDFLHNNVAYGIFYCAYIQSRSLRIRVSKSTELIRDAFLTATLLGIAFPTRDIAFLPLDEVSNISTRRERRAPSSSRGRSRRACTRSKLRFFLRSFLLLVFFHLVARQSPFRSFRRR